MVAFNIFWEAWHNQRIFRFSWFGYTLLTAFYALYNKRFYMMQDKETRFHIRSKLLTGQRQSCLKDFTHNSVLSELEANTVVIGLRQVQVPFIQSKLWVSEVNSMVSYIMLYLLPLNLEIVCCLIEVQTTLPVAMFLLSCGLPNRLPLSFLILLLESL